MTNTQYNSQTPGYESGPGYAPAPNQETSGVMSEPTPATEPRKRISGLNKILLTGILIGATALAGLGAYCITKDVQEVNQTQQGIKFGAGVQQKIDNTVKRSGFHSTGF